MNTHLTLIAYRHGQSMTNSGATWPDPVSIPLTAFGHQQSLYLANHWSINAEPDLIITSNMLRTQQTAAPTSAKFSTIASEIWPIHEFCYLSPVRCANTTWQQRQPWVDDYWKRADPFHSDGDGAESFAELITRIETTLELVKDKQKQGYRRIAFFSHGQFLSVLLDSLRLSDTSASPEHMQRFRERELQHPIKNAEGFIAKHQGLVSHDNQAIDWQIMS